MAINLENFEYIKARGEELYKSFEPVRCPYFNELVYFTAEGLEHLKYKHRNRERLQQDQFTRFKLFHLVPIILKLSRTLQGRSKRIIFERVPINSRRQLMAVECLFYEFIAIIEDVRLRVVVKQLFGGKPYFWSVIPYWTSDEQKNRNFNFGNPNED